VEYDTLHDLNIKLLNIPIIFKENYSSLGMVILDSVNMLENFFINITEEKSIIFSYNNKNRKSLSSNSNNNNPTNNLTNAKNFNNPPTHNKKKIGSASEIFSHIYQVIYFYQKNLGFNLINLIWDYERGSLFNQINYNRTKYNNNFRDFEVNNNLNIRFHYLNISEYIVYKVPIKPLIGIQLIPVECLHSSDEGSGIFAIVYMEEITKMKVNVFRVNKNCSIDHLQEFTENVIKKNPMHILNDNENIENQNETKDESTFIMSQDNYIKD